MTRTQISLEKDLYRTARAEARRRGISFAELCRQALRRELPVDQPDGSAGPSWMKWAGALESGEPTASRSVDAVVYGTSRR